MMDTLGFFMKFLFFCFVVFFYTSAETSSFPEWKSSAVKVELNLTSPIRDVANASSFLAEISEQPFSGLVDLFSPVSAFGETMANPISEQRAQNCEPSGNQGKLVWSEKHSESLLFGWIGGLGVYIFISWLYYRFFS